MNNQHFHDFLITEADKTAAKAIISAFVKYKRGKVNESEINLKWVIRFTEYLDERGIAANSRKTYTTILRTILKKAVRRGYSIDLNFDDVQAETKVSSEASESIYINAKELKMIEKYKPKSEVEQFVRAIFLICAYVGCRISDAIIMTKNNLSNGEVSYTCEKTKTTCRVPMHKIIPELIKQIQGKMYAEASVRGIVGANMKKIGKEIGLNERLTLYRRGKRTTSFKYNFIGTHTARKSFCTNMYLDGYTLEQVSKMMGHANTEITMRYLCVSHTDTVQGSKTYLNPDRNPEQETIDKFKALTSAGLNADQAAGALVAIGYNIEEVERVKVMQTA